ncbi:MAG: hypothetical protein JRE45_08420 [Deltaproteobacteria bacterium]|nr:hypothetical protein [Deltaproteobacteria bacterium]
MRYIFGFVCVCGLGMMPLVGCSDPEGGGGTGGEGGSGGIAGMGGEGGSGGIAGAGGQGGTGGIAGTGGQGGTGGIAGMGGQGGTGGIAGTGGQGGTGGVAELCIGDDATGDTDGDGVCDDLDLCPAANDLIDVDGNDVADCVENVLLNPGLNSDVSNWEAGGQATLEWDTEDADADPGSGSAAVTNITGLLGFVRGAGQCVELGEGDYVAAARYFIPAGQGPGRSELNMTFHGNTSCIGGAGNFLGNASSPFKMEIGVWDTFVHPFTAVSGTQSVKFLMQAQVMDTSPAFTVQYDNLLLH